MTYQEDETGKLKRLSSKQAIDLAMQGRWQEAVTANQTFIESFPDDVDAFNRLGRAYMELGEYAHAKESYQKALKVDPYNTIARKNINRLSHLKETRAKPAGEQAKVEPHQFIEEVAKAGVVNLRRLAAPDVLAKTVAGSRANLKIEGPHLVVENNHGEYLGQVEPRHANRLIKLTNGGNRYAASIISSSGDAVSVIIREVYQHPSQVGQPSFPPRGPETIKPEIEERLGDRMIRRKLEDIEEEEALPGDTGYAIVGEGEGETEILTEESGEDEEEEEIDSDD